MVEVPSRNDIGREAVRDHLEGVLASPSFRSTEKYSTLLRYLVDRTLADDTPHEVDIAVDVFGKDQSYDPTESSSVRVCVHQLRKKLDEYYLGDAGQSGIRLSIPKGSYRVSFGAPLLPSVPPSVSDRGSVYERPKKRRLMAVSCLLAASLIVNALLLLQVPLPLDRQTAPPSAAEFAWEGLLEGPEPILIGLGDVFFFTEIDPYSKQQRYVRDIRVNSVQELQRLFQDDLGANVHASELTYLPKSIALALEAVLPAANRTGKPVSLKLMSEVTAKDLREHDFIYVGFLRSMGVLGDYFLRTSNFSVESPFLGLRRKDTGETFAWSGDLFGQTRDYGLFAKMSGPGQGEIVVFTGISGIGMLHAVRALTDQANSRELERYLRTTLNGIPSGVEVLFEVMGYDRVDLEAKTTVVSAVVPR